jgi:hypothetical protein
MFIYFEAKAKFSSVLLLVTPQSAKFNLSSNAFRSNFTQPPVLRANSINFSNNLGCIDPFVSQQIRRILSFLVSIALFENSIEKGS